MPMRIAQHPPKRTLEPPERAHEGVDPCLPIPQLTCTVLGWANLGFRSPALVPCKEMASRGTGQVLGRLCCECPRDGLGTDPALRVPRAVGKLKQTHTQLVKCVL